VEPFEKTDDRHIGSASASLAGEIGDFAFVRAAKSFTLVSRSFFMASDPKLILAFADLKTETKVERN
jgi:hypothetical protein